MNYCPDNPVTHGEMAVFLMRTAGLGGSAPIANAATAANATHAGTADNAAQWNSVELVTFGQVDFGGNGQPEACSPLCSYTSPPTSSATCPRSPRRSRSRGSSGSCSRTGCTRSVRRHYPATCCRRTRSTSRRTSPSAPTSSIRRPGAVTDRRPAPLLLHLTVRSTPGVPWIDRLRRARPAASSARRTRRRS